MAKEESKEGQLLKAINEEINRWDPAARDVAQTVSRTLVSLGARPTELKPKLGPDSSTPIYEVPGIVPDALLRVFLRPEQYSIGNMSFPTLALQGRPPKLIEQYVRLTIDFERSRRRLINQPTRSRLRRSV